MKKKLYIGLLISSICFVLGGLYITDTMDHVINDLRKIITLHQVEMLRENLLTQVKIVQSDLLLKDTPHARDLPIFVDHVDAMARTANACFDCHHAQPTQGRLDDMRQGIINYQAMLSRVYTIRANKERVAREKQKAFEKGRHLVREIDTIVVSSTAKLAHETTEVLQEIGATKWLISLLVIGTPILGLLAISYFINIFTGSLTTLIKATHRIQQGDLTYRITGMRDEFGLLANSFNDMSSSLVEQIQKIEETRKRYQLLFENAGDGIFILEAEGDRPGKIVSANPAAATSHGYTVDELEELHIADLDFPEKADNIQQRLQRILNGEHLKFEMTHRRKDGTLFPLEASASLMEYEGKKYILAFDRDLTERKLAQEMLQRAKQLAIVGEMAAGLAHEIKNPLSGIKVSIEVLSEEVAADPEKNDLLRRVLNEIRRIEILLKDLLDYARPSTAHIASVNLNQLLESTIKSAHITFRRRGGGENTDGAKNISVKTRLLPGLPPISADLFQIQQVFLNLLINAADAIPRAGTITVATSRGDDSTVRVSIIDTGTGIDADNLAQLFKPFFTTKPKGNGLGLAICKRLIEDHHGIIEVSSTPGEGTTFTIILPMDQG